MQSLANAVWPRQALPQATKDLLTKFYHCVDSPQDPNADTVLADEVFAPDATFKINNRVLQGREEIMNWRGGAASGGGSGIKNSLHAVEHVYSLDGPGCEMLTTGVLHLEMKDGKKAESKYAARGKVVEVDGGIRFSEWQGWVDYMPYFQAGMIG